MKILNASILYTEAFLFHEASHALHEVGIELRMVTEMQFACQRLAEQGVDIALARECLPVMSGTLNEEVSQIENFYSLNNLRRLLVGDRFYAQQDESEALTALVRYIRMWERDLEERPVDAVFMDFGGELLRRSLYLVATSRGIPVLYLNFAPFPKSMVWLDNEYNAWDDLASEPISAFSPAEIAEVETYIAKLRRSEVQFSQLQVPQFSVQRVKKLWEYLQLQRRVEKGQNPHFAPDKWWRDFLRRRVNRSLERRFLSTPGNDERFVFFPLHVSGDAQLTVRAPHLDQEALITQLARALPFGYKLYVKGHPSYVGGYPIGMLRRISCLPNVRLIDPRVHAHTLLRKASAVTVINSTTGLEALIFGLPVIVLGPTYYRAQGLTYDVGDPAEFEAVLARALREPTPVTDEALQQFLLNLRRAVFSGSAYFMFAGAGQMTPSMLATQRSDFAADADAIAQSIEAKLKRLARKGRLRSVTAVSL